MNLVQVVTFLWEKYSFKSLSAKRKNSDLGIGSKCL